MSLLLAGKILGTHHLKGAVKVFSNIQEIESLVDHKVIVETPENVTKLLTINSIRNLNGSKWIFEFEEVRNKIEGEELRNSLIKVSREVLGISEDEYLVADLIGLKAIDNETGEDLGEVTDIFETLAHNIYIINSDEHEIMVPDVDEFIKSIDYDKREIKVHLLEGMKEPKGKK